MWKRILIGGVIALVGLGATAWLYRTDILIALLTRSARIEVAENRPIEWTPGPAQPQGDRAEGPPNIIFILADDLGINDISTFGGGVARGQVPTPNIDRLAREGAIFNQAYSGTGTCAPSRAMLMTGRYPSRTGFEFTPTPPGFGRMVSLFSQNRGVDRGMPDSTGNLDEVVEDLAFQDKGLPGEEVTVAEALKAQGYRNIHIGKWHLGRSEPFRPVSQGFDESLLMAHTLYLPEDHPDVVNAKPEWDSIGQFQWRFSQFAAEFNRAGEPYEPDFFEPAGYLTDYWTDEAVKVIEANKNQPFFLYLAHWGPHTPLQATKADYEAVGDIGPHHERVYAAMIHAVDRSVGRIMDTLEEQGLADNTIIVFSSDNGGAGYVGLPDINAPYRGWKITLFEGGIRVPMFVKWPKRIEAGTVIETPVAHIDVMPTLVAAAGGALPDDRVIDGRNILPLAAGESESVERENDALFWSSGFYKVVRAGDWKLQWNQRQDRRWLFNLADDPTEQVNLAQADPEKLAEMEGLITAHWAEARAPLYAHQTEGAICIDKTSAELPCEDEEYVIWPN